MGSSNDHDGSNGDDDVSGDDNSDNDYNNDDGVQRNLPRSSELDRRRSRKSQWWHCEIRGNRGRGEKS